MSDQMTYMLPGDIAPRRGPKHLAKTVAFRTQGGRVIPDIEAKPVQPIEPAPKNAKATKETNTKADADQA